jgi:hypothetical protein
MTESIYINTETNVSTEVNYVPAHFRRNADHRYKVIFRDLDADAVIAVRYFSDFDTANASAEELVFPSPGMIAGPVCVPPVVTR